MNDTNVSRRKLFMHPAHKTVGVSAGLAALQACDLSQFDKAGSDLEDDSDPKDSGDGEEGGDGEDC